MNASHVRRTLAALAIAVLAAPQPARAQRARAIAACSTAAPALDASMLREGATVRFTARVTRSRATCAYRTTTRGCFATCTSHGLARGMRGALVRVRGGGTDCASTDRSDRSDCPFADNQTLALEGTLRRFNGDWWLDATSACRL